MLLAGLVAVSASPAAVGQTNALTVYGGATVYADPAYDSVASVEFPFSLTRDEFEFFRPSDEDSALYARIFAQIDLINAMGIAIDSTSTYFSVRAQTSEEARQKGVRLFNSLRLFVAPGIYTARLTVIDAVSKRKGEVFLDRVLVEPSVTDRIQIGGPTLAYSVTPVVDSIRVNMRMVRNGLYVVPNPVAVFSTVDTAIHLYGELYNLADDQEACLLVLDIFDKSDSLYRACGSRDLQKPGPSAAFGQSIDIKGLPTDTYRLRLVAKDRGNGTADTNIVRFAIISPDDVALATAAARVRPDPYDDLTLQERTQLVSYVLTPGERKTLKGLNELGKKTFLRQYWAEHDSNPETAFNEGRFELITRFRYVNEEFSLNEGRDDGWSTQRGRIYMTYGPSDEVDDSQAPRAGDRYQIWYYRMIDEGKVFVFVDSYGNDDYRLVHSNVFGEIYDKDWADALVQGFPNFEDDL